MKYIVGFTSNFKKQYKKIKKQGRDLNKLYELIEKIANNEELPLKYKNHKLEDDKRYKDCSECHITPDWLLIYQKKDKELILLLMATGSHFELFK